MAADPVRIERLVIRVPDAALGPGQGDGPARRYALAIVDALGPALRHNGSHGELARLLVRVEDHASPSAVATQVARSIPRGPA